MGEMIMISWCSFLLPLFFCVAKIRHEVGMRYWTAHAVVRLGLGEDSSPSSTLYGKQWVMWFRSESMTVLQEQHLGALFLKVNGHFRNLNWRYLPYIRPMFQGYVREYPHKILPYMVQYLHFRILKFPLKRMVKIGDIRALFLDWFDSRCFISSTFSSPSPVTIYQSQFLLWPLQCRYNMIYIYNTIDYRYIMIYPIDISYITTILSLHIFIFPCIYIYTHIYGGFLKWWIFP